jgi:hypothetical protein
MKSIMDGAGGTIKSDLYCYQETLEFLAWIQGHRGCDESAVARGKT